MFARYSMNTFLAVSALIAILGSASTLVAATDASSSFKVEFEVKLAKGKEATFVVEVFPDWAPLGAAQFREIISAQAWDAARFFRVVSGFMVRA